MTEYDCKRIVYSSSATVYGTPPVIPIPETTRLQADSPYGKTKVMVENIIDDLCHCTYLILVRFIVLILHQRIKLGAPSLCDTSSVSNELNNVFLQLTNRGYSPAGAHPSGMIGEDPRGRPGNLLPLLAYMAVGRIKDATLKVFGNDYPTPYATTFLSREFASFSYRDGTCVRDYLHIMDLASGHVLALEALTSESKIFDPNASAFFKAYNLGKGRGVSVLQIVEAMRKATGFDYKYEVIGRR